MHMHIYKRINVYTSIPTVDIQRYRHTNQKKQETNSIILFPIHLISTSICMILLFSPNVDYTFQSGYMKSTLFIFPLGWVLIYLLIKNTISRSKSFRFFVHFDSRYQPDITMPTRLLNCHFKHSKELYIQIIAAFHASKKRRRKKINLTCENGLYNLARILKDSSLYFVSVSCLYICISSCSSTTCSHAGVANAIQPGLNLYVVARSSFRLTLLVNLVSLKLSCNTE